MISAKELKDILRIELSPEGKVLLLGMITDGGVDLSLEEVGNKYGLIPSEVQVAYCDLKSKHIIAIGPTPATFNVQREVVRYGSNTTVGSTGPGGTKRTGAHCKKTRKKNKNKNR